MCDHCSCRSFPPIAELTAEHEIILELAWEIAEATRERRTADGGAHDQLLALLERHVAKEETGLYPALLSTDGMSTANAETLAREHLDLHQSLSEGPFGRLEFLALAAHIEEEEMNLFPAAMLTFDDEEWDATADAHRAVDGAMVPSIG